MRQYEWLSDNFFQNTKDELFLDLAIYNMKKRDKNYYKILEKGLMKIGGLKTLISNNYYSESEFWKIWNKDNYFKIKLKTDPKNIFRNLFEKTCRASMGLGR
jgi:hypothetical protein